jgi:hypothetical protein
MAPPAPLEAGASRPPAASARRHRFTEIRDTRNLLVTGPSLEHADRGQPHLFAAGPLLRSRPAAIGMPHDSGHTQQASHHRQQSLTFAFLKIVSFSAQNVVIERNRDECSRE